MPKESCDAHKLPYLPQILSRSRDRVKTRDHQAQAQSQAQAQASFRTQTQHPLAHDPLAQRREAYPPPFSYGVAGGFASAETWERDPHTQNFIPRDNSDQDVEVRESMAAYFADQGLQDEPKHYVEPDPGVGSSSGQQGSGSGPSVSGSKRKGSQNEKGGHWRGRR